jgi:hypothetical protein
MTPHIELGDDLLSVEDARRLLAAATATADELDRDGGAAAIHDGQGGVVLGGVSLPAADWRALAERLAECLREVEELS